MGKKSKNQRTLVVPSFESYAEDRARAVADSAANVILQQTLPDVPKVPAYRFDGDFPQSAIGLLSNIEGRLGVFDATRIDMHGYEPNPETCLFTSTSKYGDSGARATSNKLFKDNPGKYGFVGIPMGEIQRGDLLQFSEGDTPKHSAIITGENEDMIPLVSYSRGGTGATTITPEGELPTMAHNVNIGKPINDIGPASAYRYTGSPEKRKGWASEYYDKYNPKEVYPNLPVYNLKELEFKPVFNYSEGGFLAPRDAWDRLSMREQAEMMKVAVKNGIYDLATIRQKYNEFAEGGNTNNDNYYSQMEKVAEENYKRWGFNSPNEALIHALNDNTYNYKDYYKENPASTANADTHWPDTYKTVYHPTFSEDSKYSGQKSQYNPQGLPGGFWSKESFVPMAWQVYQQNKYEIGGPIVEAAMNEYKGGGSIHIKPSHRGRLTELKARTGKSEAELYNDGNPAHKKMVVFARNARKWHGLGGNLFYPGGEITYGKPFYSYDENGQKIDDTLNYNATIPELVIIPDSRKTPAQRNEDERYRQRNLKDYDEEKSKEFTTKQIIQSQKDWEKSFEKKALDYAQAAATGIGIGADVVSGLPVYSSLKGASVLSRAETPVDYIEGGLWLTPLFGEAYQTAKPMVNTAVNDIIINHPGLYQYPRYAIGKLKYGMDAELPTVYRKVSNLPKVENGRVTLSNPNNRFAYDNGFGEESPIITNFTTDAPVRSHSAGNWDRDLTLAFPGKTLLGRNIISTQPSDTFIFGDNITVPVKNVTGFSGRAKELNYLNNNGVNTVTSPEAEIFWESGASNLMNKIAQARATNAKIFQNRGKGIVLLKPKTPYGDFSNYANTIENLTRETFKSPTLKDYQFMDYVFKPRYTSRVIPKAENFTFGFVNKNPIFGEWLGNSERRTYLEQPWRWKNVMYDPLTPVESDFRSDLNIGLKPEYRK